MKRTRQIVKNEECIIVICSLFFCEKTEKYTKYTYRESKTKYIGKNLQL